MSQVVRVWALVAGLLLGVRPSLAPAEELPAASPTLPVLQHLPAIVAPPDTAPWPEDGQFEVLIDVEVANDGAVLSVKPPADLPPVFARPAVDAALGARFLPARDNAGQAVDATVQLRIRFDREAPPPLSIQGHARARGSSIPLAALQVVATASDGRQWIATTDSNGLFVFAGLPDGAFTLTAQGSGLRPLETPLTIRAGAVQDVELRLIRDAGLNSAEGVGAEIVVYAKEAAVEVTERPLNTELSMVLPGTNGDVVKVVQSLPGVARSPLGTGNLIIRGTAPEDSAGFIDGTPLPIVFHFGGLSTVLDGQSVAEVGYIPGNAGVRYGRFLGGLVDIRTRDSLPEHPRRSVSVDLFQAGAFVDTPLGDEGQTALSLSARRSYIDTVLQPVIDARDVPVQAPVYADVQSRLVRRWDSGTHGELLLLASKDTFAYIGIEDGEEVPALALAVSFWRLRGRVVQPLGPWEHELSVAVGVDTEDFASFGYDTAVEQVASVSAREEWRRPDTADQLGVRVGLDVWAGREMFVYDVESYGPFEAGSTPFLAPALYGEVTAQLGSWSITPGLRGDLAVYPYDAISGSLDPRLQTRWQLSETWSLIGASGTYSRLPAPRQVMSSSDGNPDLIAERSWQNSLGVQTRPTPDLLVEVTGYANLLHHRIVGREDRFQFRTTPLFVTGPIDDGPYENDGTGSIFGGELFAKVDRTRFVGWIAATVSRSRRVDRPGEAPSLFSYDQPVVLTALGTTTMPKNWRLGSRLRFGSGNPYTPVVQRFQDMESRVFVPVYGDVDSERLAPFFAIDLRVDKTWTFSRWRLTGSLDLQNISVRSNQEVPAWTSTYTDFTPISGLPPIPVFGLKGEW